MSGARIERRITAAQGRVVGRLRRLIVGRVALIGLGLAGIGWLTAGPGGWGAGSWVPLWLDVGALGAVAVAVVRGLLEIRERSGERLVSRAFEHDAGLPEGTIRSALELHRAPPSGVSQVLVSKAGERIGVELERVPGALPSSIDRGLAESGQWLRRSLAAGLLVTLVLGALSPVRMWSAWGGLANPVGVLAQPSFAPIDVRPGNVEIPRGATLEVVIRAGGRPAIDVVWQSEGDISRRERVWVREGEGRWSVGPVTAALEYRIEADDGARTPSFSVTPVDPLFLGDVTLSLRFPDYTQRLPEEYRSEVPLLDLPAGTEVRVQGSASGPIGAAALVPDDPAAARVELAIEGPNFAGGWVPARSGRWGWHIDDVDGQAARALPDPVELVVRADEAPMVRVLEPGPDTLLSLDFRQPLVIQAADDYGVAWLELVVRRIPVVGAPGAPVTQRIDAGGVPGVIVRPVLDLADWGLVPGDRIEYWVRVSDTHPQPREGRSETGILRVPEVQDLRREAGEQLDAAAQALDELRDAADEAAREAREAERTAAARREPGADASGSSGSNEGDFEQREQVREALAEAESRGQQVDSLRQMLEQLNRAVTEAGAASSGLQRDLGEVSDLLQELGQSDAQAELGSLLEQMENMDSQRAAELLDELAADQEQLEAQLEEAVERLRRAAARQQFEATTREAQELATRQAALAETLADDASPERAAQQAELTEQAAAVEEQMGELGRRLDSMGEREAGAAVQRARAEAERAQADMARAAAQAREGDSEAAAASARQAAQRMDDAAQQMAAAQQQMAEERAEAFLDVIQQTLHDALALARRQHEVTRAVQEGGAGERANARTEVAGLLQGTERMARRLAAEARASRAGGAERPVLTALGDALDALDRTLQALDRPSMAGLPSPALAATQAGIGLNRVALRALETADQLSQGAGSSQSTPQQAMEQLQELAQDQADLNNEASQLMPMELTPQAMQQQMQRMAQQQQQVADQVGDLAQEQGEGPLGDLEAMAQEAEALARALEEGRLDATTRERQERLFHRLLDAGRSLEREGETTEREADAPGLVEPESVNPLSAEALGLLRYRLDPATLDALSPGARALVRQYFQRLNEAGPLVRPPEGR